MRCPFCESKESIIIDSKSTHEKEKVRRKRECVNCFKRFTTYEILESIPIIVIKKNKSREVFDRNKILNGIIKACEKRPVTLSEVEKIVDRIQFIIQNSLDKEIDSKLVGEYVIDFLKDLDNVAYVRFASVYKEFSNVDNFMYELKNLLE